MMKTLIISSSKGGVGKTTVAVNLALAFSKDKKVGLLDADINAANVPIMLGMKKEPMKMENDMIIPHNYSENLKVISEWFEVPDDVPKLLMGADRAYRQIKAFCKRVKWGKIDMLLSDAPPSTSDELYGLTEYLPNIDGAILITQGCSKLSVADAKGAKNVLEYLNIPILGFVRNMAYMQRGAVKMELFSDKVDASNELELEELAVIPFKRDIGPKDFMGLKNKLEEILW